MSLFLSSAFGWRLSRVVRARWMSRASLAGLLLVWACGAPPPRQESAGGRGTAPPLFSAAPRRAAVVVLGDSLATGLGLPWSQAFPAVLQRLLDAEGYDFEVINAGVSGDTSAGGLRRLDWALDGDVRILVVELGGNDGLRGLPVGELRNNLAAIIERAQGRQIAVLLAGLAAPPNYGEGYTRQFRQVYADLARTYAVTFVPFLLEGVAGNPALNQADGIHPNAEGARRIAERLWQALKPMVDAAAGE